MERWQRVRKSVVLVSAALLVAAFVLYRAGVIGPSYMSSSKSTFIFVGSSVKPPDAPAPADDKKAPPAATTPGDPEATLAPPPRPVE